MIHKIWVYTKLKLKMAGPKQVNHNSDWLAQEIPAIVVWGLPYIALKFSNLTLPFFRPTFHFRNLKFWKFFQEVCVLPFQNFVKILLTKELDKTGFKLLNLAVLNQWSCNNNRENHKAPPTQKWDQCRSWTQESGNYSRKMLLKFETCVYRDG